MSTRAKVIPFLPRSRPGPGAPIRTFPEDGAWSEILFVGFLLLVNLVPLVSVVLGLGRWSQAELGFAAACTLLAGRELAFQLRDLLRACRLRRMAR